MISNTITVLSKTQNVYAYSIFCEGIDLLDCDDLSHQHAEPLRIEEIQITQLRLYIIVVQEHPTLMEKINGLQREKHINELQSSKICFQLELN